MRNFRSKDTRKLSYIFIHLSLKLCNATLSEVDEYTLRQFVRNFVELTNHHDISDALTSSGMTGRDAEWDENGARAIPRVSPRPA